MISVQHARKSDMNKILHYMQMKWSTGRKREAQLARRLEEFERELMRLDRNTLCGLREVKPL